MVFILLLPTDFERTKNCQDAGWACRWCSPAPLGFLDPALGFTEAACKRAAFKEGRQREFVSAINRGRKEKHEQVTMESDWMIGKGFTRGSDG